MLSLITELPEKRGCAIIVSTHLLTDVDRVCDSAVIMHQGSVRFAGTIDELRARGVSGKDLVIEVRDRADLLRDALVARGAEVSTTSPVSLIVTLPDGLDARGVLEVARASGVQLRTIEPHRASMEQAFLRVVSEGVAA
jgi:ABC-2 type transport system ATP-binding protein